MLTVLLEVPLRCRPLSKRGEEAPLPGWLDGPGDPVNEQAVLQTGLPGLPGLTCRSTRRVPNNPWGKRTGTGWA